MHKAQEPKHKQNTKHKSSKTQNPKRLCFVKSVFCVFGVYLCFALSVLWVFAPSARAAPLTYVKDTITASHPNASANHTMEFIVPSAIPVSGEIIITPEAGDFTIPSGLDYTDIDLTDDGSDLRLATSPGSGAGSAVGVLVATGTSGSITLTLNNTNEIAASSNN